MTNLYEEIPRRVKNRIAVGLALVILGGVADTAISDNKASRNLLPEAQVAQTLLAEGNYLQARAQAEKAYKDILGVESRIDDNMGLSFVKTREAKKIAGDVLRKTPVYQNPR